MMKRVVIFLLSIVCLTSCFLRKKSHLPKRETSKSFNKVFKNTDNEYRYKMAEQFYAAAKYSYALQLYEDLFPYLKGTDRYEDMYYKCAFCYYNTQDYLNAEYFFKSFTETFPASKRTEECSYMRAYCYYKQTPKVDLDQTNTQKAMTLMQSFINTYPTSTKAKQAAEIIEKCREKIELKEYKAAELYYNLGYYKAAAIAFSTLSENFPDSKKAEDYKLQVIKSYYNYAQQSIELKQEERYKKVITECADFMDRFDESKLTTDIKKYKQLSEKNIQNLKNNEQVKKTN